jgi:hypothetical protein
MQPIDPRSVTPNIRSGDSPVLARILLQASAPRSEPGTFDNKI